MIISHKHRFVFVKTTKTAGTSVEIALSRHCGPEDVLSKLIPKDEAIRLAKTGRTAQNDKVVLKDGSSSVIVNHNRARKAARYLGPRRYQDYFSFAFERNPFDRVVSAYFYIRENRQKKGRDVSQFSFDTMVRDARLITELRAGGWHLYTENDIFVVDRIYRFEELDASLADIYNRLGIVDANPLPHTKKTNRERDYRQYYTAETRAIIEQRFASELEYFDYQF